MTAEQESAQLHQELRYWKKRARVNQNARHRYRLQVETLQQRETTLELEIETLVNRYEKETP